MCIKMLQHSYMYLHSHSENFSMMEIVFDQIYLPVPQSLLMGYMLWPRNIHV